MKRIFFFDNLVTPKILVFLYWLSLLAILISAITSVFFNGSIFYGVGILIAGSLLVRIWFELVMIAFKNNEYLRRIADNTSVEKQ